MADRVGVINRGELILVEEKAELMRKLGQKRLVLQLQEPLGAVPPVLHRDDITLAENGAELVYSYDAKAGRTGITTLLGDLATSGIRFTDLRTEQSSLEDIFVNLVRGDQ